jgi:hypothetical protein
VIYKVKQFEGKKKKKKKKNARSANGIKGDAET